MTGSRALGKTARNEQIKLRATTYNAVGLAFVAIGCVQPVVAGVFSPEAVARVVIAIAIGYILRRHALNPLGHLED
jgi:sorbitol-specific phosphotransferase system component IIBC